MTRNGIGIFPAYLALFLFSLYMGLYWAAFACAVNSVRNLNIYVKAAGTGALWVALEYLRGYLFTGFPWLLAGYALWSVPEFLQISSFTGIYGVSFLILLVNAFVSESIQKKNAKGMAAAAFILLPVFILGSIKMRSLDIKEELDVAVLQGNISQYKKFDMSYRNEIMETYRSLHETALAEEPGLIVWPETAVPDAVASDIGIYAYMQDLAKTAGMYELFGSIEKTKSKYYNSAYVISPDGVLSAAYRKIHILPFGEYFPMRRFLTFFAGIVDQLGDYDAGTRIVILEAAGYRIATGICFESIFPGLVRKFFVKGADIFVNITNDGWFLDTAGPYQHFIHSVPRAVENCTYVIRSANTGISAVIDPAGRITGRTGLLEEAVFTAKVSGKAGKTFYSRRGDVFAFLCIALSVVVLYWGYRCSKNSKARPGT
jgi:apolipoprotein N-acyltransferase